MGSSARAAFALSSTAPYFPKVDLPCLLSGYHILPFTFAFLALSGGP